MRVQTGSSALRPTGKYLGCRRDQQPTLQRIPGSRFRSSRLQAGYSIIEVVMGAAIIALVYGMIIQVYMQCGLRAEWSGYSLAAQSLATEQIEQTRSAVWDPANGRNEITQLNLSMPSFNTNSQLLTGYTTGILDVPYRGTNYITATNYVTIQLMNLNGQTVPPVQAYFVQVKTVWPFFYRGGTTYFTNTAATLLGPDNRLITSM